MKDTLGQKQVRGLDYRLFTTEAVKDGVTTGYFCLWVWDGAVTRYILFERDVAEWLLQCLQGGLSGVGAGAWLT